MFGLIRNLIQDFRQGFRSIKRSRGLALGVVISMGLGVGLTASVSASWISSRGGRCRCRNRTVSFASGIPRLRAKSGFHIPNTAITSNAAKASPVSHHIGRRMVLLQGMGLSSLAAVIGLGLARASSGGLAGSVSYVNPHDPAIYIGVLLLMLSVTGAACYIPARRAAAIDPVETLKVS